MESHCTVQTVVDILHTRVGIPLEISNLDTVTWDEMGVESLGLTEVCTNLEQTFGVALPLEEVMQTHNIQELVTFVNLRHAV